MGCPNTEKRVENMMSSGVIFTKFEVFGQLMKHCLKYSTYLFNQSKN